MITCLTCASNADRDYGYLANCGPIYTCLRAGSHALVWAVHSRDVAAIAFYERLGATFSDDLLVI